MCVFLFIIGLLFVILGVLMCGLHDEMASVYVR